MSEEIEIDDLLHASLFSAPEEFNQPQIDVISVAEEEVEEEEEDNDEDDDDDEDESNEVSKTMASDNDASDDNSSDFDVAGLDKPKGLSKRAADDTGADMDEDNGSSSSFAVIRSKNEVPLSRLPLPALRFTEVRKSDIGDFVGCILNTYFGHAWDEPDSIVDGGKVGSKTSLSQSLDPIPSMSSVVSSSPFVVLSIVVQGCDGSLPVDEGSIFCLPDGRVLGTIEEVFGPVRRACYLLRVKANRQTPSLIKKSSGGEDIGALSLLAQDYNDEDNDGKGKKEEEEIKMKESECTESETKTVPLISISDLVAGARIHCVSSHSRRLFPDRVQAAFPKGSDASNFFDEEVEAHEMEHSDDEEEAKFKAAANIAAGGRGGRGGGRGGRGRGGLISPPLPPQSSVVSQAQLSAQMQMQAMQAFYAANYILLQQQQQQQQFQPPR